MYVVLEVLPATAASHRTTTSELHFVRDHIISDLHEFHQFCACVTDAHVTLLNEKINLC